MNDSDQFGLKSEKWALKAAGKFRNKAARWSVMIGYHTHPERARKLDALKNSGQLSPLFLAWLDTVEVPDKQGKK